MTHAQKVKMARKMLIRAEVRANVPIFESRAWTARRKAISKRVYGVEEKKTISPSYRVEVPTRQGWFRRFTNYVKKIWNLSLHS